MICLYVLKLEEKKYYVGITRDLDERLSLHEEGIELHPPSPVGAAGVGARDEPLVGELIRIVGAPDTGRAPVAASRHNA